MGKLAELNDMDLVTKSRAGDEDAFAVLYQRYRLPLYSYIHKLMPTESSQVDDIFQQVWVKAVSNWSRYTDQQKLLAWLCRIAHNLVMDYYRSRSRAPMTELPETLASEAAPVHAEMDREAFDEALAAATERLSAEQREVLMLRKRGVSFKEIAEMQQTNLNTVLGRMHYAIKNLRGMLAEYL
ncbi:RNA polymerase sigma factor [Oligosphaera ethanolica]|jgi:RNA polymerase sigma-70 factor (ECF subfamily)|uniref:RNA polymerase sigma-70 factor (ECF subfamily) n=1 Tax=Oligosphaera ethanolica TaxID=760260 RepID=A0AAE3VD15_9BACT|nr:sigma-70 family RNA polymerase sigma factor [Oligosphaera ethanolica]MDQ0288227.1 RNA polymerase sigma-70 factor (ECF subfamily) [Oligosphaera ethanolica]NLE56540.1 sigma-70 family RNA polymerase sigma factor [Lentisphaerota bacterium]HQL08849.1 sigma-70 family RNA polymerase sigma factor [Lentisphaeria bacterium]